MNLERSSLKYCGMEWTRLARLHDAWIDGDCTQRLLPGIRIAYFVPETAVAFLGSIQVAHCLTPGTILPSVLSGSAHVVLFVRSNLVPWMIWLQGAAPLFNYRTIIFKRQYTYNNTFIIISKKNVQRTIIIQLVQLFCTRLDKNIRKHGTPPTDKIPHLINEYTQ